MIDLRSTMRLIRSDCERLNEYAEETIALTPLRYLSLLLRPQISALALHRLAHHLHVRKHDRLARLLARLGFAMTGAEIHPASRIGARCLIVHTTGLRFMGRLGDHATLFAQIRIGPSLTVDAVHADILDAPTIGHHAVVASRAMIVGAIRLADNVHVSPCSLIDQTIPQGNCLIQNVAGTPLRILKKTMGAAS